MLFLTPSFPSPHTAGPPALTFSPAAVKADMKVKCGGCRSGQNSGNHVLNVDGACGSSIHSVNFYWVPFVLGLALQGFQWVWATIGGGTAGCQTHPVYFWFMISPPQTYPTKFVLSGPLYRFRNCGSGGVKWFVHVLAASMWQSYLGLIAKPFPCIMYIHSH